MVLTIIVIRSGFQQLFVIGSPHLTPLYVLLLLLIFHVLPTSLIWRMFVIRS
jgi:hypothetical protein